MYDSSALALEFDAASDDVSGYDQGPQRSSNSPNPQDVGTKFEGDNSSDVTPNAIRSNWFELAALPEEVFSSLYRDASLRESAKDGGFERLSPEALESFLEFWALIRDTASAPVPSITPKGYVFAEWYKDEKNCLAMMFDHSGQAFYSLFNDNRPCEGYEGRKDFPEIANMLSARSNNPFSWSDLS